MIGALRASAGHPRTTELSSCLLTAVGGTSAAIGASRATGHWASTAVSHSTATRVIYGHSEYSHRRTPPPRPPAFLDPPPDASQAGGYTLCYVSPCEGDPISQSQANKPLPPALDSFPGRMMNNCGQTLCQDFPEE